MLISTGSCACVRASVRLPVGLSVYPLLEFSDSTETIKVTVIKLGTVIASYTRMHHVLIILTLTFIHGHTDSYTKCSNVSESFQAMSIKLL